MAGRSAPGWRFAGDPKVRGFRSGRSGQKSFGGKSALEQFPHRRGPAGHAFLEAKIVNRSQFRVIQHDLQALSALSSGVGHDRRPNVKQRPDMLVIDVLLVNS
jgi:hypothetical protein